jgi:hypothetical protein
MSEFALCYDAKGRRLSAIGSVALTYDFGGRPLSLGDWWLAYDRHGGDRLRQIGPYPIEYDTLGTRPRSLGTWRLDYDKLGNRLCQIGPFDVGYDRLDNRVRSIGPMTVNYRGHRPSMVELAGPQVDHLPESCLLALYVVLLETARAKSMQSL